MLKTAVAVLALLSVILVSQSATAQPDRAPAQIPVPAGMVRADEVAIIHHGERVKAVIAEVIVSEIKRDAAWRWNMDEAFRAAERARIAEEKRLAEEAAAAAAAEAARIAEEQAQPYSPPSPSFSDPYQRIDYLMAQMGVSVGYRIGDCGAPANGCYFPGSGSIIITPTGLTQGDCGLQRTISHEMRHIYQEQNGLIEYVNRAWANIDWLEADARAAEWCV